MFKNYFKSAIRFIKNNKIFAAIAFLIVFVAALLSVPATIYFMTKWLNNFAFKTQINWWIFVISFAIAAVVVLFTAYIHSYKASCINPVKALRYE